MFKGVYRIYFSRGRNFFLGEAEKNLGGQNHTQRVQKNGLPPPKKKYFSPGAEQTRGEGEAENERGRNI